MARFMPPGSTRNGNCSASRRRRLSSWPGGYRRMTGPGIRDQDGRGAVRGAALPGTLMAPGCWMMPAARTANPHAGGLGLRDSTIHYAWALERAGCGEQGVGLGAAHSHRGSDCGGAFRDESLVNLIRTASSWGAPGNVTMGDGHYPVLAWASPRAVVSVEPRCGAGADPRAVGVEDNPHPAPLPELERGERRTTWRRRKDKGKDRGIAALLRGTVFLSSVLATRLRKRPGQRLSLAGGRGSRNSAIRGSIAPRPPCLGPVPCFAFAGRHRSTRCRRCRTMGAQENGDIRAAVLKRGGFQGPPGVQPGSQAGAAQRPPSVEV